MQLFSALSSLPDHVELKVIKLFLLLTNIIHKIGVQSSSVSIMIGEGQGVHQPCP